MNNRVAVLIPCFNESKTIVNVINDFRQEIPDAAITVYDNGSEDNTLILAKQANAIVKVVPERGKGQVIRRMFADIDADIYVMVDGDATYDAKSVGGAIELLTTQMLDMVICVRHSCEKSAYRAGHILGNKLFNKAIQWLFGHLSQDVCSGYRVFSRRFVKSFPIVSQGFEIEAEMTIHALQLGLPVGEIETPYRGRPKGSMSKLNTLRDGGRIFWMILWLFISNKPMALFGWLFAVFVMLALALGLPIVVDFIHTGLVPKIPTAILAASLGILSSICLACGIVLDSVSKARLETKRFWYLNQAGIK